MYATTLLIFKKGFEARQVGEDVEKQGAVNGQGASRHDHSIVGVLATVMNVSSFAIW